MKILFFLLSISFSSLTSFAAISDFVGNWKNTNSSTSGMTKINIGARGTLVRVNAFGKCHPTDCNWGVKIGYPYASSVSSNIVTQARAVTVDYSNSFSKKILTLRRVGTRLEVKVFTRFTDGSRRTSYTQTHYFKK